MHTTHSNTQYKNESKHSEMGPVRENPIQRTVSLCICVCIALCTIVATNIAQKRPDSFPPYPPDNHHCSDDVYLREGGSTNQNTCTTTQNKQETKASFSRLLRHPAWKRRGPILISALHKFVTYLLRHLPTHLHQQTHTEPDLQLPSQLQSTAVGSPTEESA